MVMPRQRLAALRQIAGDRVVEAEPAFLGEHDHGGGGELLSDRAGLIDRAVGGRHVVLDVGEAVAAGQEHAVSPEHGDRQAGDPLPGQLGPDVAVDGIEWSSGLGDRRRGGAAKGERSCA